MVVVLLIESRSPSKLSAASFRVLGSSFVRIGMPLVLIEMAGLVFKYELDGKKNKTKGLHTLLPSSQYG